MSGRGTRMIIALIIPLLRYPPGGFNWPLNSPSVQAHSAAPSEQQLKYRRLQMVEQQLRARGITDKRVLKAIGRALQR